MSDNIPKKYRATYPRESHVIMRETSINGEVVDAWYQPETFTKEPKGSPMWAGLDLETQTRSAKEACEKYQRPVWVYRYGRIYGFRFAPLPEGESGDFVAQYSPDPRCQ